MGESWYSIGLCTTIIYKNIQDVRYYFVRRFYSHCLSPCDLDIFICSASKTIHTQTPVQTSAHTHSHAYTKTHTHAHISSIHLHFLPAKVQTSRHTHTRARTPLQEPAARCLRPVGKGSSDSSSSISIITSVACFELYANVKLPWYKLYFMRARARVCVFVYGILHNAFATAGRRHIARSSCC